MTTTTTTTATTTRPAYRQPWTHGAKAYPQADTFDALRDGTKRKRKSLIDNRLRTPTTLTGT